ncbi:MAG TPA: hypothetical protein VGZ02_12985 [Candidatus Baltobacteraceae bacterium]|jgi:cell division protein FtsB|nr:hypothetical protein [Candidatus Baltobacteraceae bacterium]
MKRRRSAGAVRLFSRLVAAVFSLVLFALISVQFARIVKENIAMADSLSSMQRDIASLKAHNRREQRAIRRLLDPQGAIPEIHDRLRLVSPNEAIIYVKAPHTANP